MAADIPLAKDSLMIKSNIKVVYKCTYIKYTVCILVGENKKLLGKGLEYIIL